ncbi:Eukaryotic translation initiation factor 3 subunit I, partial [Bienertia sinuspersici]
DTMVKFESKQSSASHFLVLKDEIDGDKKTNWVSSKSPKSILNSSHQHEKATTKLLSLLYDRISRKKVTWSPKPQFGVTFSHILLYWEWTEDIIRRCKTTLMKIYLIDVVYASMFLYKCNSPLMQSFCEFWCPTTNTVLTGEGEASISLWDLQILGGLAIHGAFYNEVVPTALELEGSKDGKKVLRPSRKYSATILPKVVENFSNFGILESWSNKHEALTFLNVPEEHRQPAYFAAFLSYWLCACVHRLKNLGALMIAFHGASNGTSNGVSNIKKLTSAEAKAFILSRLDINWIGHCMRNTSDRLLVDDCMLRQDTEFLLSIRSCFLTLRYGNDHVVKPYNSHRFSRQFGFCQNIPGALKRHSEVLSLQYLWVKKRPLASSLMKGPYFTTSLDDHDEDELDFAKELETICNTFTSDNTNAKELQHTSTSVGLHVPTAASDPFSMYATGIIIAKVDHCVARFLPQQMRTKLLQTPLANIHELDSELRELFGYISSKNIDVTSLQEHVGNNVEHTQTFHALIHQTRLSLPYLALRNNS